jgi:HEAT repeat protein
VNATVNKAAAPPPGAYSLHEFIQNLLELLNDEDQNIVRYTARELRDYDTSEVRDGLLSRLQACPPQCVPEMVATLESFRGEEAAQLFFELSSTASAEVRAAAIDRLGSHLGEADFVRVWALLEAERDPRCVASLLSLLGRLSPRLEPGQLAPHLASADARVRANALELLGRLPVSPDAALIQPLLEDVAPRVRANAMKLLWPTQGESLWKRLQEELESRDERRELSAIYLLGQIPVPVEAVEALTSRLRSKTLQIRLLASKSLLTFQGTVDLSVLCSLYMDEEHTVVRQNLMSYCRQAGAESAVATFAALLADQQAVSQVRATAARALGDLAHPKAIPALMTSLRDADARVRANVIEALARCPCEGMMQMLMPSLEDENARVQAAAATAVWQLGGRETVDVLLAMLRSGDSRKQASAAFALGEIGRGEVVQPLTELLEELQSAVVTTEAQRQLQKNVMKALTKIRSK